MLLIPAITLKEGRAVGIDGKPYSEKPEDFAARLVDAFPLYTGLALTSPDGEIPYKKSSWEPT